jgi:tripartite ATP-independent transporter DctP family solute receptor
MKLISKFSVTKGGMKMKKLLIVLLILICLSFMTYAEAESATIIKYSHMNAIGSHIDIVANRFKELLETETDGKVEVRIFPAGQLGDEKEVIVGIQLGTIEMATVSTGILSNLIPEIAVISFPYIFRDFNHVQSVYTGEIGKDLTNLLVDRKNIGIVLWLHQSFRDMLTSKIRIESIEDFKGVKFRSPDIPVYVKMFQAIGASPVPIPWTETYQAMQTNIVDGMETAPSAMATDHLYEVGKYVIKTGHLYGGDAIIISHKFYQNLPTEVQKAMEKVAKEMSPWVKDYMEKNATEAYDILREKGCEIIEIDKEPLREACKTVWEDLAKETPALLDFAERIVQTK